MTKFPIFWVIISSVKNPRPQSGAKINLSGAINCSASLTLFSISSTDSMADLATFITPKVERYSVQLTREERRRGEEKGRGGEGIGGEEG